MKATLDTSVHRPAVVTLGSWDAFLPEHEVLLDRLTTHARRNGLASVAALLSPPPPAYISDEPDWPIYDDPDVRAHLIRERGVDAVLKIDFSKEDLRGTAKDLLYLLTQHAEIAEFWFGTNQTFGRGSRGSQIAMCSHLKDEGIKWSRLPESNARKKAARIRSLLTEGRPAEAATLVGRPPVWSASTGASHKDWKPGDYSVVGIHSLKRKPLSEPHRITLPATVDARAKLARDTFETPYLVVCEGPAELADASSRSMSSHKIRHSQANQRKSAE